MENIDNLTSTFYVRAIVFPFGNIILHILLNSSSPVNTVDEGGGEMKTNEVEGDVDDGSQPDEGSSDSEGLDANKLYKYWEKYKDGHKLER